MEHGESLNTEESQLVRWFNSKVNPAVMQIVNLNQLVKETTEMTRLLRDKINWSRHLANSNSNWNGTPICQVMQALLSCYRDEWIRLVVQYHYRNSSHSIDVTSSRTLVRLITGSDHPATTFFLIIYLMDRAKIMGVICHDPPLFRKNLELFESEQVLSEFCRQLTAGSVTKLRSELKSIGYTVEWRDSLADSIYFPIVHLNHDICDGTRVAKMIQILFTGQYRNLISQLKYPATKNVDKMLNLQLLFSKTTSKLREYDSMWTWSEEDSKRIALGYRRETLEALRSLIRVEWALKIKQHFLPNLDKVILIQLWVRNLIQSRQARNNYLKLRETTIWIQRKFCANRLAKIDRQKFQTTKNSVLAIQRWYRKKVNLALVRNYVYRWLKKRQRASIVIQRHWRGYFTRLQQYQCQPSLISCVQSLYKLNLCKSDTIGIRALKVMSKLSKRLYSNSDGCRVVNDQFVADLEQLHQFVYYSKEIRVQLAAQNTSNKYHVLQILVTLMWNLNRSEQHKRTAFLLISLINFITDVGWLRQPPTSLVPALLHLTGNYLNYAPLVSQCLHLLAKLVRGSCELCDTMRKDRSWCRLRQRILQKYGSCETATCQSCSFVHRYATELDQLCRV